MIGTDRDKVTSERRNLHERAHERLDPDAVDV
jgi:hypothetical protein